MTAKKLGRPRSDHKQFCQSIAPDGWQYGGYDEGFYLFQSGGYAGTTNYRTGEKYKGFYEMLCIEEDLTAKNLVLMVKHGVTRIKGFDYAQ